jgi:hypothetical protein
MPVVVRVLLAAGQFFRGNHAAFNLAAANVLELNGGVADVKVVVEQMVESLADARAL